MCPPLRTDQELAAAVPPDADVGTARCHNDVVHGWPQLRAGYRPHGQSAVHEIVGHCSGWTSIAESIYDKADQTTALALTYSGKYSTSLNSLTPVSFTPTAAGAAGIPNVANVIWLSQFLCVRALPLRLQPGGLPGGFAAILEAAARDGARWTARDDKTALDVLFSTGEISATSSFLATTRTLRCPTSTS